MGQTRQVLGEHLAGCEVIDFRRGGPPRTHRRLNLLRGSVNEQKTWISPEVRERAVRLVLTTEHEHTSRWAATQSVATKIGCTSETLRRWINKIEVDSGTKPGVTTNQAQKVKELEREIRELKRANEILKKAAAFFAQAELDRKPK